MQFHPLLRDQEDRIFLIHVHVDSSEVRAAMLVVDGFVQDGWVQLSERPQLGGNLYEVQLPAEVIQQSERYKGYDLVLPLRRPA